MGGAALSARGDDGVARILEHVGGDELYARRRSDFGLSG